MNKQSNSYIIIYATVLVVLVAAVLAFTAIKLQPLQQANVAIEKMGSILSSIGKGQEAATAPEGKEAYTTAQYEKYIVDSYLVNDQGESAQGSTPEKTFAALDDLPAAYASPANERALPVFESRDHDGTVRYIIPITGKGLWGPVWGYIALDADMNTIYGARFDHAGETPGLGAEIALPVFGDQFIKKTIFEDDKFVSVALTKGAGSSVGNPHAVDAISGGTLTSNGVGAMIKDCLKEYVPFFNKKRAEKGGAQ